MRINSKLTTNSNSISYKVTQQKVLNWNFKRALVRAQKSIFCNSIGHLLEAKRACPSKVRCEILLQNMAGYNISPLHFLLRE